jgi:hypothetical protein
MRLKEVFYLMKEKASCRKSELKYVVTLFRSLFDKKTKGNKSMYNTHDTEMCGHPLFDHVFYVRQRKCVQNVGQFWNLN